MKKMKKLLLLFAVIVTALVCFAFSASAISSSGKCGDNVTYTYNSTTGKLIISGTGPMRDYEYYYSSPFYSSNIKSVVINNGVTTIGAWAFYDCDRLTEVTIGDSVTTIGDRTFRDCYSLTEVTIGDSVRTIGDNAFEYCDSLTEVTIPDSVTTIGDGAFRYCSKLTEVIIPDSVTTIGDSAFEYCYKLTKVTIGDSVRTIGDSAFRECDGLTEVTIPDGVTTIGNYAFEYCYSLTEVTIGDSVKTIGNYAFAGNDLGGSSLTKVTIGDSVTTIGDGAFQTCDSLTEVNIPDSVTTIGDYAFRYCNSLTDITVDENNQYFSNDEYGVLFNKDKTTLIQYPIGNKRTAYTIPDSVTTIGNRAFYSCESLTKVTIGDSVTTIGDGVFEYCSKLTEVTIGDSVTTIGDYAFQKCYSLTDVTIGDSVTTIGDHAFEYCYSLTDVYYGGTKEQWKKINIGSYNSDLTGANIHYSNCKHIESTVQPQQDATCTKIGYTEGVKCAECDEWLSGHEEIPVLDHTDTDSDKYCDICKNYTEKLVSSGQCGDNVTYKRYADGTLIISGSGDMWEDETRFSGSSITSVIIKDGVTSIPDSAFCVCMSLEKVYIPDSVVSIGCYAFFDSVPLTDVYYGGTKEQWDSIDVDYDMGLSYDIVIHFNYCEHSDKTSYPQQNPTCTGVGYTAGVYCNICQRWSDGHEKINAKGHTYTEKIIDSAHLKAKATVERAAIYKYDCADCDAISPNKIFAHGKALALGTTSSVTSTQTTSSLTLTWSKAENATGYRIYYKLPGDMSWRTSVSYITATTKTFSGLPSGQAYRFAIRSAYKKADGTYILGGYKQIATATKAVAPANVDSLQNASSIRLNWTACPGATGYRIYYKSGNAWKICVSTTAATAHTFKNLKSGAKYTFAVRPYILVEGVVIWSNYITITTATQTISPVVTATSTSSGRIDLSWKAVNGADVYQVYYKVGNGNYKLYKTYTSAQNLKFSNLKSGTKYTFAVRGVIKGSEENIYGFHSPVTVTVK